MHSSESSSPTSRLLDHRIFGALVTQRHDIWQMNFLSADNLAEFSQKHGLLFFEKKDIPQLWQLGLLRADMVVCQSKIQYPGLIERGIDENEDLIYSDERQIPSYAESWEVAIANLVPLSPDIQLFFHPFRFYVLALLESTLSRARIAKKAPFPLQSYSVPDFSFFQSWANSGGFKEKIQRWNDIASLAIMAEPCFYGIIFHSLSASYPLDFEMLREQIIKHWEDVAQCYKNVGIELLKEIHQEVCHATQMLDSNTDVHILLRLGSGELRSKLEGKLGGSMHLNEAWSQILRPT